ncbi:MAG TPA: hypothetical protein PKA00_16650 [Saprospiraceae bacterium]|nr:hypothetical protein [Saprospiraceae bacterium]HMQ84547.1 hypothetical protein [Saprospiraceae bacterium]
MELFNKKNLNYGYDMSGFSIRYIIFYSVLFGFFSFGIGTMLFNIVFMILYSVFGFDLNPDLYALPTALISSIAVTLFLLVVWVVNYIKYKSSVFFTIDKELDRLKQEKYTIEMHQEELGKKIHEYKEKIEVFENGLLKIENNGLKINTKNEINKFKKSIILFETIISLNSKKIKKIEVLAEEFLLIKNLHVNNLSKGDPIGDVTKYREQFTELNYKNSYSNKIKQLAIEIDKRDPVAINAAISYLNEIIKQENERENEMNSMLSGEELDLGCDDKINDDFEEMMLEDFEKLKLETKELMHEIMKQLK